MKTIQYWALSFGLVGVSICTVAVILTMKCLSALASGFFMDAVAARIENGMRRVMVYSLLTFDNAEKIIKRKKNVVIFDMESDPFTSSPKSEEIVNRALVARAKMWEDRTKNKKFRVLFQTASGVTIWACIVVEHCSSCAIYAAIEENKKMKFVDFEKAPVVAVAEFMENVA